MSLHFIKYYFTINIFVGISWCVFQLIHIVLIRSLSSQSNLILNRLAQVLFISSLCLPIVFSLLPEKSLPDLKIEIREPLLESLAVRKPIGETESSPNLTPALTPTSKTFEDWAGWDWDRWVTAFLLVGFSFVSIRFITDLFRLRRTLTQAISLKKLGRVSILVSDSIKVPFSTGVRGRADVVIPMSLVSDQKDFKIAVKHEIQHHRNGDTAWILFLDFFRCLFYLNPFFYLWKKNFAEIQEYACDEALIRQMRISPRDYGHCLVKVAEAARGTSSRTVGTTCMGIGPKDPQKLKSFLRRRIEMFRDHQHIRKQGALGITLGTIGVLFLSVCAFGAQKTMREHAVLSPNPGVVQLDADVQKITTGILDKYIKKFKAKGGFVLVSETSTGKLLAVASSKSAIEPKGKNWPLSFEMEPASSMKGVVVAAAVDQEAINLKEFFNCENGKYEYGGRTYRDWKRFGDLRASEVVMQSSNICGIKIGEQMGTKGLEKALQQFGFGSGGTTNHFPEARAGRYPKISDLKETDYIPLISTGYSSISGFYITPLEMLHAYGAIANDGKLMKPIQANDTNVEVIRQAISPSAAQEMREVLIDAVKSGTGSNARSRMYLTAGKTSTAYGPKSPEHSELGGEKGIAGFVGFAPARRPKLVVYVGIIDPTNSEDGNPHGNGHAAPVFKEVIETLLQKMNVEPDKPVHL